MTPPGGALLEYEATMKTVHQKITKMMMLPARMLADESIQIEDVTESFRLLQFGQMMLRQLDFEPEMILRVSNYKARVEETIKAMRAAATGKMGVHVSNGQTSMHVFLERDTDAVLIKMWLT